MFSYKRGDIVQTSERIKPARKKAGLTQKKLAEILGTSQQNLAQYENGKRKPKIETLKKIASALGVEIEDLAEWNDIPEIANKVYASELIGLKRNISEERYCFSPEDINDLKAKIDNYISLGNEIENVNERRKYFGDVTEILGRELFEHLIDSQPYGSLLDIIDFLSYYLVFTDSKQGQLMELVMDLYENKYLHRTYWENLNKDE